MMEEDKYFNERNILNAEMQQLLSNLAANTSDIGDWKVIKIYEARMKGDSDPYNFDELMRKRQDTRNRINEIREELKKMENQLNSIDNNK